jgi:hypothetical protein
MPKSNKNSELTPDAPNPETPESIQDSLLSTEKKKEEAVKTMERINFWIANCDTKISFALAFAGILIGGFFSSSIITSSLDNLIKKIRVLKDVKSKWEVLYIETTTLVLIVFILLIITSVCCLVKGLKGSINPTAYKQDKLTTDSYQFFGTIQSKVFTSFKDGFETQTQNKLQNDYLSQIYINSKICQRKFDFYHEGVTYLIYSTVTFILLNILFLFIR